MSRDSGFGIRDSGKYAKTGHRDTETQRWLPKFGISESLSLVGCYFVATVTGAVALQFRNFDVLSHAGSG